MNNLTHIVGESAITKIVLNAVYLSVEKILHDYLRGL